MLVGKKLIKLGSQAKINYYYNIITFSYYFGILVLDLLFYIAIPGKTSLDEIFLEVVRSPA